MKYNVTTFRKAGLEAKRGRGSGRGRLSIYKKYLIYVRKPGESRFIPVDYFLWHRMQRYGVLTAYELYHEFLNLKSTKEGVQS